MSARPAGRRTHPPLTVEGTDDQKDLSSALAEDVCLPDAPGSKVERAAGEFPQRLRSSHASAIGCRTAPRGSPGGARRDRTDDLMLAKHALSQLSYGPQRSEIRRSEIRRSDA